MLNVSSKLELVNTDVSDSYYSDGEMTLYSYACNETVVCSGETLWGYTKEGQKLTVTGVQMAVDAGEVMEVNVTLAEQQIVYTDEGFAQAISELLGVDVDYTEQGMQDYGYVSLE